MWMKWKSGNKPSPQRPITRLHTCIHRLAVDSFFWRCSLIYWSWNCVVTLCAVVVLVQCPATLIYCWDTFPALRRTIWPPFFGRCYKTQENICKSAPKSTSINDDKSQRTILIQAVIIWWLFKMDLFYFSICMIGSECEQMAIFNFLHHL